MQGPSAAQPATAEEPISTPDHERPQADPADWQIVDPEQDHPDEVLPMDDGHIAHAHPHTEHADAADEQHTVEVYGVEPVSYAKALSIINLAACLPVYLLGMGFVRYALGLHVPPVGAGAAGARALALYVGLYIAALCGGLIYNLAAGWTGGIRIRTNHPLPAHARLYEVRRVGTASGVKVGALAGIYLGIVLLALSLVVWPSHGPAAQPLLWLLPLWLGMGLAVAGALGCLLYDLLARLMGGVMIKLS